jgi:hypothetical protein
MLYGLWWLTKKFCNVIKRRASRNIGLSATVSARALSRKALPGRRVMPSPRLVAWLYRLSVSGLYERNRIFAGRHFPLTARAKLLMMAESAISFATIALVASRAIGILN